VGQALPAAGGADDPGAAQGPPQAVHRAATMRVVEVASVEVELPSAFPVVTLREVEPPFRALAIPIGMPEGIALAQARHKVPTPRPLTHELFATVLQRYRIDVVDLRVVGRRAGTYLAELDLVGPPGSEVVPCRPSDGMVLALRAPVAAPILVDERLFEEPGDVEPSLAGRTRS